MTSMMISILVMMTLMTVSLAHVPPKMTKFSETIEQNNFYPVTSENYRIPSKRTALLFDRLMMELQKAVDNQELNGLQDENYVIPENPQQLQNLEDHHAKTREISMDLQRRGDGNGIVYWRCYFNAVTCFKKK